MSLFQTLRDWEPLVSLVTLVLVMLIFFKVRPSLRAEGLFDRSMPTGVNNLGFASLRNDTGSNNDFARVRGYEGMTTIDQGPSFHGPVAYQQIANDQATGVLADNGEDDGRPWVEGMSSRLSKIRVAEGAVSGKTDVVLNPY